MSTANEPGARVWDCEIQTRFRDMNVGWHVDNVEAVRVIDEARIQFFMFADVFGTDHGPASGTGLLRRKPEGVADLMGAQRVDYHAEMRFVPFAPFLVRLWICHIGRTSFTVATELRVAADRPPALIAESTFVFWDRGTDRSWEISNDVRDDLATFSGPRVGLRG